MVGENSQSKSSRRLSRSKCVSPSHYNAYEPALKIIFRSYLGRFVISGEPNCNPIGV